MPFDGSGNFTSAGPNFPAVALTVIESAKYNAVINDIGAGLSQCITRNGVTTVLADIPFSGFGIKNVDKVIKGGNAGQPISGFTYDFNWNADDVNGAFIAISRWEAAAGAAGIITAKSRHATIGSHTIVNNNDSLSSWYAYASDGTGFVEAGSMRFEVDGVPGINDMPARWILKLSPDGSATPAEVLRVTNAGILSVAGNTLIAGTTYGNLGVRDTGAYGGSGPNSSRDGIVLESNTNTGISILTPNTAAAGLVIGDPESAVSCQIRYTHSTDTLDFIASGTVALALTSTTADFSGSVTLGNGVGDVITINGETVSQPNIPCFLAFHNAQALNQTGNGTDATIAFNTEVFDQSGDFASNTFTAPATGRYLLTAKVSGLAESAAQDIFRLSIVTSNRTYSITQKINIEAGGDEEGLSLSVVADMDAADTAIVKFMMDGAAGDTADIQSNPFFSGVRVA